MLKKNNHENLNLSIPNTVPKTFYFHFFRAFTVHSLCSHSAFTVCSLVLSAPLCSQSTHRAFTKFSPCAHRLFSVHPALTVRSSLTYRSVILYLG